MRTSLIVLLLAACSCDQHQATPEPAESSATGTPSSETTAVETPVVETPVVEAPQPDYEVHEWGLINVAAEGVELAAGPGQAALIHSLGMLGFGKPVLYFHLAEDSPSFDARVEVRLQSFRLGEYYPAAERNGSNIVWNGRLEQAGCTAERTYPAVDGPECEAPEDGYCEAAELAEYETDDHSCFHIGDAEWPLLFYRGMPEENRPALPLTFSATWRNATAERTENASVTIGKVWYMVDQEIRAVADWPAPGESVVLEGSAPTDPRASMHADLIEHGLTEEEAQAFGRAWYDELFGALSTEGGGDLGGAGGLGGEGTGLQGTGRGGEGEGTIGLGNAENTGNGYGGLPGVRRLVYWLPVVEHDSMAELNFDPAPSAVRRATLVRDRTELRVLR